MHVPPHVSAKGVVNRKLIVKERWATSLVFQAFHKGVNLKNAVVQSFQRALHWLKLVRVM